MRGVRACHRGLAYARCCSGAAHKASDAPPSTALPRDICDDAATWAAAAARSVWCLSTAVYRVQWSRRGGRGGAAPSDTRICAGAVQVRRPFEALAYTPCATRTYYPLRRRADRVVGAFLQELPRLVLAGAGGEASWRKSISHGVCRAHAARRAAVDIDTGGVWWWGSLLADGHSGAGGGAPQRLQRWRGARSDVHNGFAAAQWQR
jgi:hypothetical protein